MEFSIKDGVGTYHRFSKKQNSCISFVHLGTLPIPQTTTLKVYYYMLLLNQRFLLIYFFLSPPYTEYLPPLHFKEQQVLPCLVPSSLIIIEGLVRW